MSTTTPRPPTRPVSVAGIPAELAARPQWVCWKWEWVDDRWTKVPYNAKTGGRASSTASATWAPVEAAIAFMERHNFPGIGFVVTPHDPFVGIDLDHCRDSETGDIEAWARQIVDDFDSLTEITPSETGLRIWITTHDGLLPGGANGRRNGPVEVYGAGRFFTVTGHRLERTGAMIAERTAQLEALCDAHFRPKHENRLRRAGSGSAPLSDEEIMERARSAENGDKFMRLLAGDTSEYGGDDSAADLAFQSILAFWTQDPAQLDRIFRRSGLYREKWERADYRERTIDRALDREEIYIPSGRNGATPNANRPHVNPMSAPWTKPEPLPIFEQPEFPVDLLPEPERIWVKALAIATQTPVALPAMMSDGAVAIAVAKRFEVEVRDGWREPLNAYNFTALDSGTRKTAVARAVEAPVKTVEKLRSATMAPDIAKARARRDVVEKRLERLKKHQAAQDVNDLAIDGDIDATINELLSGELVVPVAPRNLVDDITPERLADLMGQHGERMGVLSAEGGIFQIVAGRYSDGKADGLDLFLKGHSGDSLPIDRLGRETKHLDAPALSLVISPQTEVLRGLARYPAFRGRGFLARFDYAVPRSTVGRRKIAAAPVPDIVTKQYEDLFTALLALPDPAAKPGPRPGNSGNSVNASGPITLTLSEEAAERFIAFETWLEPQLDRDDGALGDIQDWASKLAGRTARWAGRFHVVEHIQASRDGQPSTLSSTVIDAKTVEAAIEIAKTFLIPHARTAFAMMSRDQTESRAHRVLHMVRSWPQTTITKRDIWRRLCRSFTAVGDLDAPLALLVEHGYLRPVPSTSTGRGRKPSPAFDINPLCRREETAERTDLSSEVLRPSRWDVPVSDSWGSVDGIAGNQGEGSSVDSVNRNRDDDCCPDGYLGGEWADIFVVPPVPGGGEIKEFTV